MKFEAFKSHDLPKNVLARMTEVKNSVQLEFIAQKYGDSVTEDQFHSWIATYGEKLNDYFYDHPTVTLDNLKNIRDFIYAQQPEEVLKSTEH